MTDKLLSKERLAEIEEVATAVTKFGSFIGFPAPDVVDLLSHIRAQADLLAAAETALEWAFPFANATSADCDSCDDARATLIRIREARK